MKISSPQFLPRGKKKKRKQKTEKYHMKRKNALPTQCASTPAYWLLQSRRRQRERTPVPTGWHSMTGRAARPAPCPSQASEALPAELPRSSHYSEPQLDVLHQLGLYSRQVQHCVLLAQLDGRMETAAMTEPGTAPAAIGTLLMTVHLSYQSLTFTSSLCFVITSQNKSSCQTFTKKL